MSTQAGEQPDMQLFSDGFMGMFLIVAVLMIVTLADLVVFIMHAIKNKAVNETERIVWILVFVFAGVIGFPIYWYMRIHKAGDNNATVAI